MPMLTGPEVAPRSGKVRQLVIFLHGLGSNGDDLISLAGEMDDALPDTQFLSPNAPFPFDMADFGYQWFSLTDRDPERILREIQLAVPKLNGFIDAQATRFALPADRIALVGFSQGCMMALYTALRRPTPLAGVVGISGMLHGAATMAAEITARPPICLIHGEWDEVVPFPAMAQAESALRAAHVPVEAHARPRLGHGIDLEGVAITTRFLQARFSV